MTELELKQLLSRITRPDETARTAAHAHWASLAKPLGGLGRLETMLEDAAALTGTAELAFSRRAVLVLCADNGVVAQGVSQTDQSVTRAVAENLAARRTSVCQMAKTARCEVVPVDLGIAGEPVPSPRWSPAVSRGALPSASSTSLAAGSVEQWLANTAFSAAGQSRTAHRAATPLMKPSISTGSPSSAPPRKTPHSPAISNPPSLESTSRGSAASGRFRAMPRQSL